jgi:glycerol kinase
MTCRDCSRTNRRLMTNEATLLIDVGGQGCRALIVDETAEIRCQAKRTVPTKVEEDQVEQDAEALAAAVADAVAEACRLASNSGLEVGQAALAIERGSVVCWQRSDGGSISPVISWRDRRGLSRLEALKDLGEEIRQRSGLRFSPYGGASKLAWCLERLPAVQSAGAAGNLVLGPLGSFLLARLLEQRPCRVDDTLAQRSLLWSRHSLGWDRWLVARFGLPMAALPRVTPSRSRHGLVKLDGRELPLTLLMGDQNCVPFIDGQPRTDTLYINLGTGAFLLRPLDEPVDEARFQLTFLGRQRGGLWALEGTIHGCASALRWLERQSGDRIDHAQHKELRKRVDQPPLFINTVDGLGSPWWCPGASAGFVDSGDAVTPDARLLGVLESIAFLIAANVAAMNERTEAPRRVVLGGGLSRSPALSSLIADLLEVPCLRLDTAEATAMGLWCRLHRRALPDERFQMLQPDPDSGLRERYQRWLEQITSAQG